MPRVVCFAFALMLLGATSTASAQAPPPPPPPLWDVQTGLSYVATGGNSDTTTVGADFGMHRRWPAWIVETAATAVRSTNRDVRTAERYIGAVRGQRKLSDIVGLSAGERVERDRLAGLDFRSILDGGLGWALRREPPWTLDAVTALAWLHEQPIAGLERNDPAGVFQLLSKVPLGTAADSTQRITYYPNFKTTSAYRSEAEVTAQAAINGRLAMRFGYLWRYANTPVPGFRKADDLVTASIVVRWKSTELAR
jgi:putative salt-induced outer membrane protein YdiY